ncbi:MAG TPA: hypothetical protein VNF47_11120, partial [Streptosporangiaceae bacterium]|nr:hypothetical protein [Streptosporangiaceae bacterium]
MNGSARLAAVIPARSRRAARLLLGWWAQSPVSGRGRSGASNRGSLRPRPLSREEAASAGPAPRVSVAGESGLFVGSAEIPSDDDVARLGRALAAGRHGDRDELMA